MSPLAQEPPRGALPRRLEGVGTSQGSRSPAPEEDGLVDEATCTSPVPEVYDDRTFNCEACEDSGFERFYEKVDDGVVAEVSRRPCRACQPEPS